MHQDSTAVAPIFDLHVAPPPESTTTPINASNASDASGGGDADLDGTFAEAKARVLERFERAYLEALVHRCGGNLSKASRQAGIARNHLRALLKKLGLYERRFASTATI